MNRPAQTIVQLTFVGEAQHVVEMAAEGSNGIDFGEHLEAEQTTRWIWLTSMFCPENWLRKGCKMLKRLSHPQDCNM